MFYLQSFRSIFPNKILQNELFSKKLSHRFNCTLFCRRIATTAIVIRQWEYIRQSNKCMNRWWLILYLVLPISRDLCLPQHMANMRFFSQQSSFIKFHSNKCLYNWSALKSDIQYSIITFSLANKMQQNNLRITNNCRCIIRGKIMIKKAI